MKLLKRGLAIFLVLLLVLPTKAVFAATQTQVQSLIAEAIKYGGKKADEISSSLTGEWCTRYIQMCAKNAGIPESIISQSSSMAAVDTFAKWFASNGTFYSFYNNSVGTKVSRSDFTPQPGDLVVYDWNSNGRFSHMEIVTDVSSTNIATVGGNTGNENNRLAVVTVRNFTNGAYCYPRSDTRITGYARPNYSAEPVVPRATNMTISTDKTSYQLGETITFTLNGENLANLCIGIDLASNRVKSDWFGAVGDRYPRTYQYTPTEAGSYSAWFSSVRDDLPDPYVAAGNSERVYFTVTAPTKPTNLSITTDKSDYTLGETVVFTMSSQGANHHALGIDREGTRVQSYAADGLVSYRYVPAETGSYSAYFSAYNGGLFDDSSRVYFTVSETKSAALPTPTPAPSTAPVLIGQVITNEKDNTITEGVRLTWSQVSGIVYYRVYRADRSGGYSYPLTDFAVKGNTYVDVKLRPDRQYYYIVKPLISEGNYLLGQEEQLGATSNEVSFITGSGDADLLLDADGELGNATSYLLLQLDNPFMTVNGTTTEVDPGRGTAPVLRKDRTMIPIRAVTEAMGGIVGWDGATQKITLTANGNTVEMWLGKPDYTVNGEAFAMDVVPIAENERTLVPLRFAAENLNCRVTWVNETREILIVFNGTAMAE